MKHANRREKKKKTLTWFIVLDSLGLITLAKMRRNKREKETPYADMIVAFFFQRWAFDF